ncbi:MAG: glycosyltransferase, partial [Nevskiales bacterium]
MTRLSIVVPCYNEEAVLAETAQQLGRRLHDWTGAGLIDRASAVLFVDDGSRDRTWA